MKRKILFTSIIFTIFQLLCLDYVYANDIAFPENTIEYNGHTYKYYEESTDWHSAKKMCEEYGGHLVVISSIEENDFLIRNLPNFNKSFYWIGATDETKEGLWQWVTDEVFSFCNWSEDSPDNNNGVEHYAGFMSQEENYDGYPTPIGSWNDFQLSSTDDSGYICEWDFIKDINNNEKDFNKERNINNNQQVKENINDEQNRTNNSNTKMNNSQNSNNMEDEKNRRISITFHTDNLSLIGGVSIFGGVSFIGVIIKKKYKNKNRRDKSTYTQ